MAQELVNRKGTSVQMACSIFSISTTCYLYKPKLRDENIIIADWLLRLTNNQKNWGFGGSLIVCVENKNCIRSIGISTGLTSLITL